MRLALLAVTASLTATAPTLATADVLKLYAEAHGGGMVGKGIGGDLVDNPVTTSGAAFSEAAPAPAYGVAIGTRFLFVDVHAQHHQFRNADRVATWTQFLAGLDFEIPVGTQTPEDKKAGKGAYFALGVHLGFGMGTGQQVMPPLSNDEVTDKGFLVQGRLAFGKHLGKVLDVGLAVPVSAGYFFKGGAGAVANDASTHYQSVQIEALLVLRANVRLL